MEQVIRASIPIRIKNTFNPSGEGTLIRPTSLNTLVDSVLDDNQPPKKGRFGTAVTIKDNVIVLNLHSNRKSVSHGFFAKIFSTLGRSFIY